MVFPAQRTGGRCEPARQAMCMTQPRAVRPNGIVSVRAERPATLTAKALLEAVEGCPENRRPNQGGTA